MRILEVALLAILVLSLIFFFALMPGGASLVMIVLTAIGFFYFGAGFVLFSNTKFRTAFKGGLKNVPVLTIVIAVVTGQALSTLAIGILFKLLLMPGANEMLTIGAVESMILIVVNIFSYVKSRSATSMLCISRLTLFLLPAIFLLTTSPLTLVKWQYRNHPGYVDAFSKFLDEPNNKDKWEQLNLERNRIYLTPEEFEIYKKTRSNN